MSGRGMKMVKLCKEQNEIIKLSNVEQNESPSCSSFDPNNHTVIGEYVVGEDSILCPYFLNEGIDLNHSTGEDLLENLCEDNNNFNFVSTEIRDIAQNVAPTFSDDDLIDDQNYIGVSDETSSILCSVEEFESSVIPLSIDKKSSNGPELLNNLSNKENITDTPALIIPPCAETITVQYGDMDEGRKRRHLANKNEWKKNRNKKLRMEGKDYLGYSRPKGAKLKHDTNRKARKLHPTCTSKVCEKTAKRMCAKFTDEDRMAIFKTFWSQTSWDQRKIFVTAHVTKMKTKRKSVEGVSRRDGTYHYSLTLDKVKIPVCRQMFLNTLDIGAFTVQSWVNNSSYGMHTLQEIRSSMLTREHRHTLELQFMEHFLDQLPKLPSHYNRQNSSKMYLEPIVQSFKQLYGMYEKYCKEHNKTIMSRKTFCEKFNGKNLSLHKIKKDQCDICVQYETGNLGSEEWKSHKDKKDRARLEKDTDKKSAAAGQSIVLAMDLQAVKVAPYLNASAIFFKTKLCCHNFTVYDLGTNHATCYWFTEVESELVASTFTSCIIDYLTRHCVSKNLPITIYSDGCTYQNRNNILANGLLNFTMLHNIPVEQNYLERGHTQMECDSVHSLIERKLKNREIHLPSDYLTASKEARTKPFPFEVLMLDYDFFKDYSNPKTLRYPSIRPGRKVNDPTVTDIRAIKYNNNGTLQVKLTFDEDWQNLPLRPKQISEAITCYEQLNKAKLPISRTKWDHLQELKKVIPKDCHGFYDSILHK